MGTEEGFMRSDQENRGSKPGCGVWGVGCGARGVRCGVWGAGCGVCLRARHTFEPLSWQISQPGGGVGVGRGVYHESRGTQSPRGRLQARGGSATWCRDLI